MFFSCFAFPHIFIISSQLQRGLAEGKGHSSYLTRAGVPGGLPRLLAELPEITASLSLSFSIEIRTQ